MRADRRVTNVQDKDQLQSRGGVMMLTTPDITITPILEFTNGNCEVAIANLPTVNTTIILNVQTLRKRLFLQQIQ